MYIPSSVFIRAKYVEKEKEVLGRKADSDLLMTHNGLMIAHYCRTLTSANGQSSVGAAAGGGGLRGQL